MFKVPPLKDTTPGHRRIFQKHPGGWETVLAVEQVFEKKCLALWRRAHFMINFAIHFEVIPWYFTGFCGFGMVVAFHFCHSLGF